MAMLTTLPLVLAEIPSPASVAYDQVWPWPM
jgi:hypothetical protein